MLKSVSNIQKSGVYQNPLSSSSGTITLLPAFSELVYNAVGKIITVSGLLVVDTVDNLTGNLILELPEIPAVTTASQQVVSLLTAGKAVVLIVEAGSLEATLSGFNLAGFFDLTEFVQGGTEIYINITYITE